MCTRAHPYGRAGWCSFGGRGVTNGIRADPHGCAYGWVCGHRVHGACGPEMGHTAWHMGRHWMNVRALRGKVPRHLLESVCGHMHVHVVLGWGTRHGVWVGTGRVVTPDFPKKTKCISYVRQDQVYTHMIDVMSEISINSNKKRTRVKPLHYVFITLRR
jgi:hypothetical protein